MSRVSESEMYEDEQEEWERERAKHLMSAETYRIFGDLENALLAMPMRELIGDAMALDGDVCLLGAGWCLRKVQAERESWATATEWLEQLTAGRWANDESVLYMAEQMGLHESVAQHVAWLTDRLAERYPPAQLWQVMLDWLRRQRSDYRARQMAVR
jgi:hypothetical protein